MTNHPAIKRENQMRAALDLVRRELIAINEAWLKASTVGDRNDRYDALKPRHMLTREDSE